MKHTARSTLAALITLMALFGGSNASADGVAICTWGGTPEAPTGTVSVPSGIRSAPSATTIPFTVTGDLAGSDARCSGTMTLTGEFMEGARCSLALSHGSVTGLAGVTGDFGIGIAYYVRGTLIGPTGTIVGGYNAQIASEGAAESALACRSPEGYTGGSHSTLIELYPVGV